jgi:hypothetical protein
MFRMQATAAKLAAAAAGYSQNEASSAARLRVIAAPTGTTALPKV